MPLPSPRRRMEISKIVLKEPMGDWFMTVAAGLEFMYSKPETRSASQRR